jgi:hypothetical protein
MACSTSDQKAGISTCREREFMRGNPLLRITGLGQSILLDFLNHESIHSGKLRRWIQEDGLSGVTSNPEILEQAIAGSDDYPDTVRSLALHRQSAEQILAAIDGVFSTGKPSRKWGVRFLRGLRKSKASTCENAVAFPAGQELLGESALSSKTIKQ